MSDRSPKSDGVSDFTAILLSVGQEDFRAAADSIRKQTLRPREIYHIRDVSPFASAFNQAVHLVESDFFFQVDSDMVLRPHCFET